MTGEENRRMVYIIRSKEESGHEDSHEKGNIAPDTSEGGNQGPREYRIQAALDTGCDGVCRPAGKGVRRAAQGPLAPAVGAPGGDHRRQNAAVPSRDKKHPDRRVDGRPDPEGPP